MKLSKILLSATLLAVCAQANAKTVVGAQLQPYKEATRAALGNKIRCLKTVSAGSGGWNVGAIIEAAQSLEVTTGAQPALIFSYKKETDTNLYGLDSLSVVITTDASYKQINDVQVLEYKTEKVNDGTLLNPVVHDGSVLQKSDNCRF